MFFKLVFRNSRRSRKENGLFFVSLLLSVIAFYIILSLPRQDVMLFLKEMESDAVNRLLGIVPLFYGVTLVLLFFLIYYASRFQLERRRHEFGVYLMMGMRKGRLFFMLLAEDLHGSVWALLLGIPTAVLVSELISLITARLVGLGIVGHQTTFYGQAVLWTCAGFLAIKLAAFLILSWSIARQEVGELLTETPEGAKKQLLAPVYAASLLLGLLLLGIAFALPIGGYAWQKIHVMALALLLGLAGTFLFFWGLRSVIGALARLGERGGRLGVFNLRQIQETVIQRSNTLAVCFLLILAGLCCFGAGTGIARFYNSAGEHVLDYTFVDYSGENPGETISKTLKEYGLDTEFAELFEMKVGHVRTEEDYENVFQMQNVLDALREEKASAARDIVENNLEYATFPHVICQSSYNRLLAAAGKPALSLAADEAAVYMDRRWSPDEGVRMMNRILEKRPKTTLNGETFYLTGAVQNTDLVTDQFLTLSFALILPDEAYERMTGGMGDTYVNGILDRHLGESLMKAIADTNEKLDKTGLSYESYLQNMGRQLFYTVAASYLTIYLAVIFLIIANTVIGVQFLMDQRKTGRRYRTLIRLGATYEILCESAGKQINWYFGIPVAAAAVGSLAGVRALLSGILSQSAGGSILDRMLVSGVMIFALLVVEWLYIAAVKRSSRRYLLTLMTPEREE